MSMSGRLEKEREMESTKAARMAERSLAEERR
jgi:hypothetical protein